MFNDIQPIDRLAFWSARDEVIDYHGGMPADEYDQRRDLYAATDFLQIAAKFWDVAGDNRNDIRRSLAADSVLAAINAAENDKELHFWLCRLYHRFFRTCPAHGEYTDEYQTGWQYLSSDGEVSDNIEYHCICRVCGEDVQPVAVQVAVG
jgi:hypothetical protein